MNALMDALDTALRFAADLVWNSPKILPAMVVLLLCTGIFLTIRLGFVQFRKLGHAIKVVAGKYDHPEHTGDVSHYQALSSALSATVGIGNIAGVATAIHYGGPGAVFWLWLTGFLGMATKFTECTLAQKYRVVHEDGSVSGGPMYYIQKGLGPRWKWVAVIFAACAATGALATGNSIQAFTMADSLRSDFGIPTWLSGLVSATLVGAVIVGGIKRIGSVTARLVPFMGLLYVTGALLIVILNIGNLPEALAAIVTNAFSPPGMVGGFAGSTFIFTLTWGVKRGLFSNEAGQGSAPIAHAAAKTDEPVREGTVALLEPFIDTVVICFMTGLVVVLMGTWNEKTTDRYNLAAGSGLTYIKADARISPRGVIADNDVFKGAAAISAGRMAAASVVRNHSVVEDALFEMDGRPFDGTLSVNGDRHEIKDSKGAPVPTFKVFVKGRSLLNGSPLTARSFQKGLSGIFPWGNYVVTICVFLFAISTAISWFYYGDRAVLYLFGRKAAIPYKVIYTSVHFIGAIVSLEMVWSFGDAALGLMAIPNLIAILVLSGSVKKDAKAYFAKMDAEKAAARKPA